MIFIFRLFCQKKLYYCENREAKVQKLNFKLIYLEHEPYEQRF